MFLRNELEIYVRRRKTHPVSLPNDPSAVGERNERALSFPSLCLPSERVPVKSRTYPMACRPRLSVRLTTERNEHQFVLSPELVLG